LYAVVLNGIIKTLCFEYLKHTGMSPIKTKAD